MSRSYRKPYYPNNAGSKWWKKEASKQIRTNGDEEPVNGATYKKVLDRWDGPIENKGGYWDVPKLRRK